MSFRNKLQLCFFLALSSLCVCSDLTNHKHYYMLDQGQGCGLSFTGGLRGRILGGVDAEFGQYPWMALISKESGKNKNIEYECGGAVINKRYVLTAAHCIPDDINSSIVILGEYKLGVDPDCVFSKCAPPVHRVGIEEVVIHEDYVDKDMLSPDIGLIRTKKDIEFNELLSPICLPIQDVSITDNEVEVAGWGSNSKYGSLRTTPTLQLLRLRIVPSDECQWRISQNQICAASNRSRDTCNGDSGGPLMKQLNHPASHGLKYYVIGVLSYGQEICGLAKTPMTVYTNVTAYMQWILDNMKP